MSTSPLPKQTSVQEALWAQQVPLYITHPQHPNTPFITSLPRFSYLPLLLPRLASFFRPDDDPASPSAPLSSFHHEEDFDYDYAYDDHASAQLPPGADHRGVLLRNLPLGLLLDLYRPSLPWRLTVRDGPAWDVSDTFLNAAKEADFARYGSARRIMSLSQPDTATLWHAIRDNDRPSFARVNSFLLDAPTPLRAVPLRLYIPSAAPVHASASPAPPPAEPGSFKVLQALVPPRETPSSSTAAMGASTVALSSTTAGRHPQPKRLGAVLRSLLPALFPSSRDPVLANALLHGVPAPFNAPVEDLMREAAYPDGWLCLTVVLL